MSEESKTMSEKSKRKTHMAAVESWYPQEDRPLNSAILKLAQEVANREQRPLRIWDINETIRFHPAEEVPVGAGLSSHWIKLIQPE